MKGHFSYKNAEFLLPVLWVQSTEDHSAHRVMSPEEEPVGWAERGQFQSLGSRMTEDSLGRSVISLAGFLWSRNDAFTCHLGRRTRYVFTNTINNLKPVGGFSPVANRSTMKSDRHLAR